MKSVRKLSMMSNFAIVLIGLALLMVSCSKGAIEISQPTIDKEKVEVGKSASLSVDVKNPGGLKLEYKWKAEKGTIVPSQLSQTIADYTAPNMPGDDTVILEVSSNGRTVFTSQAVKIEVVSGVISTGG